MKFSVAAIFVAVASTVYAQTATPNAGVAVNLPGYGVSIAFIISISSCILIIYLLSLGCYYCWYPIHYYLVS